MRASMEAVWSDGWKLGGLATCLDEDELEKKRGEVGPSAGGSEPGADSPGLGMSAIRGGEAPVRAFLTGDGRIVSGTACLDEERFTWPWPRGPFGGRAEGRS